VEEHDPVPIEREHSGQGLPEVDALSDPDVHEEGFDFVPIDAVHDVLASTPGELHHEGGAVSSRDPQGEMEVGLAAHVDTNADASVGERDLLHRRNPDVLEGGVPQEVRPATRDVDAFFRPSREVREAAARVAARSGVPDRWLNDAVKGFLSPRGEYDPYLELPHLRVFVARPEYLLAMKCASMRLGAEFHDLDDVRYLLRYLNLTTSMKPWRS
jgi:hypothetical protein